MKLWNLSWSIVLRNVCFSKKINHNVSCLVGSSNFHSPHPWWKFFQSWPPNQMDKNHDLSTCRWFIWRYLESKSLHIFLVGGFNLPLWKMMELKSVGMMTFRTYGTIKKCSKPPTRFVSLSILCSMNLFMCKNNPPHATWMFVCNWSTTKFWLLRKLVVAMTTCHSWEDHHTISENPCHIVGSISHHTIPYPQIIIVPSRNSRFSIVLLPFFAVFLPQMDHVLHA